MQSRVIEIWARALGMSQEQIEPDDDFFALGGDSYRAAQVVSGLNREYAIDLELTDLFEESDLERFTALVTSKIDVAGDGRVAGIVRADRNAALVASSMQKRMWFLEQFSRQETDAYCSGMALWLRGTLDKEALQRAFSTIVERHESLRTVVYMDDEGEVLQRIEPAASVGLPVIVLPQGDVERFQAAFSSEKLDISIVPLIRTVLLDLGAERYVLLIRVHDIAYDGWSVSILVRELNVLYRAYCRGEPDPLAPLEVQYADYASWKMRRAGPEELKRQLGYWQKQLAGVSDLLALPTDHPRSGAQRFRGAHLYRVFPLQLLEDLRALGREEGSTLFALLMSAFNVLLWERSGQQDIPIGTLTFDRVMPGLENVIGAFLNTIVLRTRLQPRASFVEFLRRVDSTARAAYQNLDVPFESVVQTVNQKRTRSYMPLFQVMFAMQNTPSETVRLWKLELERMELLAQGARFDLLLRTTELEDGLGVWMEYNVDLFEAETIAAWVDRFRVLLEQLVTDPHRPLAQLASGLHLSSHSSLATRSMPGDSSMDM